MKTDPAQPFRDIQKWLETGEGGDDWQDREGDARAACTALKVRQLSLNLMAAVPSARSLTAALSRKNKAKALEACSAVLTHLKSA
jgi:hypothetical protein